MNHSRQNIVFIHSLNNYTGSPNILSVIIKGLLKKGYAGELITSRGDGFLSDIPGLEYRFTCYQWKSNRALTFVLLLLSQIETFFIVLFHSNKYLYYINTIVPFGAILACWITNKRFVIHVHENMRQRKPVYFVFRNIYRLCNRKSIFVSNYLKEIAINCRDGKVVYNALSTQFCKMAREYLYSDDSERKTILMVASLRRFKGVYEFAELARSMPQFTFVLVVSADESEVTEFEAEIGEITNLTVYPKQVNLHPFYQEAKLLLQLSHTETCVETFGLTILEAMCYGVPAIVPDEGGPTELIINRYNGYLTNPHDLEKISCMISDLMTDGVLYTTFSQNARERSELFIEAGMLESIESFI